MRILTIFTYTLIHKGILMRNNLVTLASDHCMYEGFARTTHVFNELIDRMYSSHKIDSTFSALGKAVGDDYNVSDRAFGMKKKTTTINLP